MEYRGFEIILIAGLFRVMASGFMLGSATTIEKAKILIDNFIYEED
jgi:hypothetical protein